MADPLDSAVIYNKCEADVAGKMVSSIGGDFNLAGGVTFPPGEFGNMVEIDANAEDVNSPAAYSDGMRMDKGIMEMWLDLNFNVVNGSNGDPVNNNMMVWWQDVGNNYNMGIDFENGGMRWIMRWNGGAGFDIWLSTDGRIDISSGVKTHLILYWDNTDVTAKRRIYLSGVLSGSNNVGWTAPDMSSATLWMGTVRAIAQNLNGGIDNLKIYGTANEALLATIIANMNNEGWPVASKARIRIN